MEDEVWYALLATVVMGIVFTAINVGVWLFWPEFLIPSILTTVTIFLIVIAVTVWLWLKTRKG